MPSNLSLSQSESANFLYSHLGKTPKYWYRRLTKNLYRSSLLHGYRITVHVVDGKATYTKSALKEFVRVNKPQFPKGEKNGN